jgi:lysyl-tRNA synthetase class 1
MYKINELSPGEREDVINSNVWPVLEAKRILERIKYKQPEKGYVLFETGYGPSGLPHIGTFGEVVRTSFVRFAFNLIAPDIKTKLVVVSDDFDGMRKVPLNVPNREMLERYIGMPLTRIPDPFEKKESYGHYMNCLLYTSPSPRDH